MSYKAQTLTGPVKSSRDHLSGDKDIIVPLRNCFRRSFIAERSNGGLSALIADIS